MCSSHRALVFERHSGLAQTNFEGSATCTELLKARYHIKTWTGQNPCLRHWSWEQFAKSASCPAFPRYLSSLAIAKLLPKAIRNACLNGESCKPHNLYCDFYRRTAFILSCQLLQAFPKGLCLGIVPRGELTRISIAKEVCIQHQSRKLPCTADMRCSLMLHAEDLKTSLQIWFFFTNSVQSESNTDPFSPVGMVVWKPTGKESYTAYTLLLP